MQLNFNFLFALLVTLNLSALAIEIDSVEVEKKKGSWYVIHIVDQGETLYSLARRYQSDVAEIVLENAIENNQISLFQKLIIPVSKEFAKTGKKQMERTSASEEKSPIESDSINVRVPMDSDRHRVKPKETLYAISKIYNISLEDLRSWNKLQSDALNIGQLLVVKNSNHGSNDPQKVEGILLDLEPNIKDTASSVAAAVEKEKFTMYLVQNGDIIESIAAKFAVRPDSILHWNNLQNTYLAIGQKLKIRGGLDSLAQTMEIKKTELPYGTRRKIIDQSGFTKILEEGIALSIDSPMESDKALALHRTQAIGSMLEVRNLMNNKKILVKVVGKLPETGLNKNTLIRLTPVSFKRLGVIDSKARVEVSYYE